MNYEIVDTCCRDLRSYLEEVLRTAKGGVVSVKLKRLLRAGLPHSYRMLYAVCLGRILRPWRWGGMYVIPRRDAETLLANLDELCASVKHRRRPAEAARRVDTPAADGETELVSFHVPHALMQALDSYARRRNLTRSAVVRAAIAQLVEKYRNVEIRRPAAQAAPTTAQEDELVLVAFHDTRYVAQLIDMYAAALQISRSDVVRTAIRQMLDKIRAAEEEEIDLVVAPTSRIPAAP